MCGSRALTVRVAAGLLALGAWFSHCDAQCYGVWAQVELGSQYDYAACYDSLRERVVLLCPARGSDGSGGTWAWDGQSWTRLTWDGPWPLRTGCSIAYDRARDRIVLFGGLSAKAGQGTLRDTWEFDGTHWRLVADSGPPAASGANLVYHRARGTTMFVGRASAGSATTKLWEWDGDLWSEVPVPAALPANSNFRPLITYDSARERLVCVPEPINPYGGTYEFSAGRWRALAAYAPYSSSGSSFVYDPIADRVVYLCGSGGMWCPGDGQLSLFDGHTWSQPVAAFSPSRSGTRMVHHEARDTFVVTGGGWGCTPSSPLYHDTWEWDRSAWTQWPDPRPASRTGPGFVFDSVRGKLVLYGGPALTPCYSMEGCLPQYLTDTWEWDPSGWTRGADGASEAVRRAMTFDSVNGRSILYKTDSDPFTLAYDGSWKVLNHPDWVCESSMGGLTFDPERARAVFVIMCGSNMQVWELVADSWASVTPIGPFPPQRSYASVAFDPVRHEVLLFGGSSGTTYFNDMWYWNGQRWAQHVPGGPVPGPRAGAAITTDFDRGVIVLSGGTGSGPTGYYDTWEWDGAAWTQVGQGSQGLGGAIAHNSVLGTPMKFFCDSLWQWIPGQPPAFFRSPEGGAVQRGARVVLECVTESVGAAVIAWRRDGSPIADGDGIRGTKTMRLVIDAVVPGDAGSYDVVCTSACGSATSAAATLTVLCPSDFNMDGFVTGDDFDGFVNAFVLGGNGADFDHNGFVNGDDFDAFVLSFSAGC